jgi:hypothetical protein
MRQPVCRAEPAALLVPGCVCLMLPARTRACCFLYELALATSSVCALDASCACGRAWMRMARSTTPSRTSSGCDRMACSDCAPPMLCPTSTSGRRTCGGRTWDHGQRARLRGSTRELKHGCARRSDVISEYDAGMGLLRGGVLRGWTRCLPTSWRQQGSRCGKAW